MQPATLVLRVESELDVAHARRAARRLAEAAGLSKTEVYRLATAVSELGNNLVLHTAGGGRITLTLLQRDEQVGVEVLAEDDGPGIADVGQAMQDGFSTNRGLGGGLPGSRRLMDEFAIESRSGCGTRVTARLWQ